MIIQLCIRWISLNIMGGVFKAGLYQCIGTFSILFLY
jgi:hypothetical protein